MKCITGTISWIKLFVEIFIETFCLNVFVLFYIVSTWKRICLHTGVQLFIGQTTKGVSCKSKNIELKEIRKDIINAEKTRPLCRTTLTVSISSIHCEKSIVDLKRICHDQIPNKTSVYFQGTYGSITKRKHT
mgnify:CR=1 FL=1